MIRTALAVVTLFIAAGPLSAHAIDATVRLRSDRVEVEVYFSDNTPARDTRVVVRDGQDRVITEGRTDDTGRWQFPAPPPGVYEVVVDAGAGHRKRKSITIPSGTADMTVSDGPSRAEFTRFPWGGVAAGLAIIVLLAVGWRAWRGRRTRAMARPPAA